MAGNNWTMNEQPKQEKLYSLSFTTTSDGLDEQFFLGFGLGFGLIESNGSLCC